MRDLVATPSGLHALHLGEGPVWNPRTQRLSVVDIFSRTVHLMSIDQGSLKLEDSFSTDSDVGAALPLEEGGFLLCQRHHISIIDALGHESVVAPLPVAGDQMRCNDAKIGPDGHVWVGIMHDDALEGRGSLWRISRTGEAQCLLEGLTIPNGMDWSDDTFWFVDGPREVIQSYHWDAGGLQQGFAKLPTRGTPDGLCCDGEGNLWLALWGEGRVDTYSAQGDIIGSVAVASPLSTSLCFAGADLSTLVITSAVFNLSDAQRAEFPSAGDLFVVPQAGHGRPAFSRFG